MHMCVCVCVIFLHHSVVLFYSSILLLWYVGYDDFISMSNVFVFVLMIIIFSLFCCLLIWRWIFLRNPSFQFFMNFCIFLYFFILFIFVSPLYTYFWSFLFIHFLSNSYSFFLFLSFTLSVCWYFFLWFFLFLFYSVSLSINLCN